MTNLLSRPNDPAGLRIRASRCRDFAREYAEDVGASLNDLAAELDRRADRLDAKASVALAEALEVSFENSAHQGPHCAAEKRLIC